MNKIRFLFFLPNAAALFLFLETNYLDYRISMIIEALVGDN